MRWTVARNNCYAVPIKSSSADESYLSVQQLQSYPYSKVADHALQAIFCGAPLDSSCEFTCHSGTDSRSPSIEPGICLRQRTMSLKSSLVRELLSSGVYQFSKTRRHSRKSISLGPFLTAMMMHQKSSSEGLPASTPYIIQVRLSPEFLCLVPDRDTRVLRNEHISNDVTTGRSIDACSDLAHGAPISTAAIHGHNNTATL